VNVGTPGHEIVEQAQCSPAAVAAIIAAFNAHGFDGLVDKRLKEHRPGPMTESQEKRLLVALNDAAPGGGEWTGTKVADWMTTRFGIETDARLGSETLDRMLPFVAGGAHHREVTLRDPRGPFMLVVVEPVEPRHLSDQARTSTRGARARSTRTHTPLR